jgi:hypothetical protein
MSYGKHRLTVLSKATYFKALLARDHMCMVHVDTNHKDVEVPDVFKGRPRIALGFADFGKNPLKNLSVHHSGIQATLAFNPMLVGESNTYYDCSLPWASIFCIVEVGGEGLFWAEDAPPEIANEYTAITEVTDPSGNVKLAVIIGNDPTPSDA